ncbi:unnamed protein product, partial [Gongylonema pulchrum]|uniref:Mutator family transposase n=1 Tax=Gongylonema pulchrum TaxID=637853 RepID=A0A183DLL2_9BILA
DIPVITEPVVFGRKRRIKERKKKEAEEAYERLYGVDRKTARVIIECARKEYNHYEGMRYPAGDIQLASQYWIKSKYKNDWFTINPITKKVQFFLIFFFFSFSTIFLLVKFFPKPLPCLLPRERLTDNPFGERNNENSS